MIIIIIITVIIKTIFIVILTCRGLNLVQLLPNLLKG